MNRRILSSIVAMASSALLLGAGLALVDRPLAHASRGAVGEAESGHVLRARSVALAARFDERGARFHEGARVLGLRAARFGREGATVELPATAPSGDASGLRYAHAPGLVEWWRPAREGLEHGFDVAERPSGEGRLVAEVAVVGAEPVVVGGGVELRGIPGARFRYDGLFSRDARGRELPSSMEVRDGTIRLVVDDAGAAYPIVIDPLVSTITLLLPAKADALVGAGYGSVLGLSGSVIVVAATGNDTYEPPGRVYVFNVGETAATPLPSAGGLDYAWHYGARLAVDGDRFAVSAPYEPGVDALADAGAVYVYERTGPTTWNEQRLTAGDAALASGLFGNTLAMQGDVLVAGASGRPLQVFVRGEAGWPAVPSAPLSPPDGGEFTGNAALSEDTLIVSGPDVVYVYRRDGGAAFTYLGALDGDASGEGFGYDLAISGDLLAIGAPTPNAVYTFERVDGTWSRTQRLTVDVAGTQGFGQRVALSGDLLLVGAPPTDIAAQTNNGAAYLYYRNPAGGQWDLQSIPMSPFGTPKQWDLFGIDVAVHGDLALIGIRWLEADFLDGLGTVLDHGGALLHNIRLETGTPCREVSEPLCEQGFCVDGFCCASACNAGCAACSAAAGSSADGTCGIRKEGLVCGPVTDYCDLAEFCDGLSTMCPADVRRLDCVIPEPDPDAGPGSETTFTRPSKDLSCGCEVAGATHPDERSPLAAGLAALGLVLALRRRRGRRGA